MINIDPQVVANKMADAGITKDKIAANDFDGWTNTLIDILEDTYQLETIVREAINKLPTPTKEL